MPRIAGLAAPPPTALALAALVLLAGARAEAYVQFRTEDNVGWSWQGTNCMPIFAYTQGFRDMTVNEVTAAASGAAAAWSARQNACTYLTLSVRMSSDPTPVVVPRRLTSLVFRDSVWCKLLNDGSCSAAAVDLSVYDGSVLMLTSSEVSTNSGAMTRAAIEVNAADFTWTDLVLHPERERGTTQDLQNALTHEMGHFIGLDHNCTPPGSNPALMLDENDQPAPDCDTAPPFIAEGTMFPTAPQGDLAKRTLAQDDLNGLCAIYPVAADPRRCSPPWAPSDGCGCATGAGAPGALASDATALSGLALLAFARRRRASSRR